MNSAELLEIEIMGKLWNRLCSLTDTELMTRRQMEMELQHNLKAINSEMNRRNREL